MISFSVKSSCMHESGMNLRKSSALLVVGVQAIPASKCLYRWYTSSISITVLPDPVLPMIATLRLVWSLSIGNSYMLSMPSSICTTSGSSQSPSTWSSSTSSSSASFTSKPLPPAGPLPDPPPDPSLLSPPGAPPLPPSHGFTPADGELSPRAGEGVGAG